MPKKLGHYIYIYIYIYIGDNVRGSMLDFNDLDPSSWWN